MTERKEKAEKTTANTRLSILLSILAALIIAILLALRQTKSIIDPFKSIFQGLKQFSSKELKEINQTFTEIISHLSSGASTVNIASQSIASGASEQAASIEETSSTLDEISSMTNTNATNAVEANNLMKSTRTVIDDANTAMKELISSMEDITHESEKVSSVVKTIDEIAFQTNLLALNAAVEAARAGDAGKGFAVVADEVRNLAQRAAEEAKDTSTIMGTIVEKIKQGAAEVEKTNNSFTEVSEKSNLVANIVNEISIASTEQSTGIDQVNTAVSQMNSVIQDNAASTEELRSQAEMLYSQIERLMTITNGSSNSSISFDTSMAKPSELRTPNISSISHTVDNNDFGDF